MIARILTAFGALWIAAGSVAADSLTLKQAADLMFRNNPSFAQKTLQVEIAGKEKQQAQSGYFPQIDFAQSLGRSNNPVYAFGALLNQNRFAEENFALRALNHPAAVSDVSSRFELGWLVYDFGRRENQIRAADARTDIAVLELDAARSLLMRELVRRYYAILLAEQRMAVAEDSYRSAQARLEQARERVAQGLAVQSDLLSAQVYEAACAEEKIESDNQHSLALASLQQLLGTPFDALTGTEAPGTKEFAQHDLTWWKQEMEQNRPELKIASEEIRIARTQNKAMRSALLPSLQAWSSYEWHGEDLSYTGDSWGAGFVLRWNLFRGGADVSRYAEAGLQARQAAERLRETRDALTLQLQSAYFRFQSAREKARVASTVLDQSEENRRVYAERYAGGLVTIQDSLQAEAAGSGARLSCLQSLYEQTVAYADLLAAAGLPDEIGKIGE